MDQNGSGRPDGVRRSSVVVVVRRVVVRRLGFRRIWIWRIMHS
ncbi:hypothetical protein [Kribbella sp. NBC_00889]|nr:hypothetical protein OG817_28245 [Kribbella sp. NBC_00889]